MINSSVKVSNPPYSAGTPTVPMMATVGSADGCCGFKALIPNHFQAGRVAGEVALKSDRFVDVGISDRTSIEQRRTTEHWNLTLQSLAPVKAHQAFQRAPLSIELNIQSEN